MIEVLTDHFGGCGIAILEIGREVSSPTLSSLASALVNFSSSYFLTGFPSRPLPKQQTNAELLILGRDRLLEGLRYFDQASALGCSRCADSKCTEQELERTRAELAGLRTDQRLSEDEKQTLLKENERLMALLEESRQQVEGLASANQVLEGAHRDIAASESQAQSDLLALARELTGFKELYTKKVSDLDALCAEQLVQIGQQKSQLESQGKLLQETTSRADKSVQELSQVQQAILFHQQLSEQRGADLSWLLRYGVEACVRSVLRSDLFGESVADLQEASMEYGRVHGCVATQQRYPDLLGDKELVFPRGGTSQKEIVLGPFKKMVEQPYELLTFLADDSVDVDALKKKLSPPTE